MKKHIVSLSIFLFIILTACFITITTVQAGFIGYDDCENDLPGELDTANCCCDLQYHIHELDRIFPLGTKLTINYRAGTPQGYCEGDTAYFYISENAETWDLIGEEDVPKRSGVDDIIHTKIFNPSKPFRYVKIYIPNCYNDWSSASVLLQPETGYDYCGQLPASAKCCCFVQYHIHDLSEVFPSGSNLRIKYSAGTPGSHCRGDTAYFYISEDNNTWTLIGEENVPERSGVNDIIHTKDFNPSTPFRYVKVYIPKCYNDWSSAESYSNECNEDDSGSIDIAGKSGPCGGKVTIPVRIQNAPNPVSSIGFDIAFDPDVLTYAGFDKGEVTEEFDFFNVNKMSDGLVRCGGFTNEEIAEGSEGDLVYLNFDVSAECHDSKLELRDLKDNISTWSFSHGCFCMKCTGDINEDGEITPKDALCAFEKYLGICPTSCGIPCDEVCCDVNADGECTPADGLCIFRKYLGMPGCLDE